MHVGGVSHSSGAPDLRGPRSSRLSQQLQAVSNSEYRIDTDVEKKLASVHRLLAQFKGIKSESVYIRSSQGKGIHFSAHGSWRATFGLRGNMGDVHKELRIIGAEIQSPRANQKISAKAVKEDLLKLETNFEARLKIKIPTKQDKKTHKALQLHLQEQSTALKERDLARRAAVAIYGSGPGGAWINNVEREEKGTLRLGMTIEKPTAGDVYKFYSNSLARTDSVFSVDSKNAVVKVLNLQHKEIKTLLEEGLGDAKYNKYYRGARLSSDQLALYQCAHNQNKPVATTFFMSVSANKKEAFRFTEPKFHQQKNLLPVTYVIHGSARELKEAPLEEESLFMPGSQFRVTKMTLQNGLPHIEMIEVKNKQNPIKV